MYIKLLLVNLLINSSLQQPPSQQSGLYIPQVQQVSQQQGPDETIEQYAQRKARPAAIPIKPPPGE